MYYIKACQFTGICKNVGDDAYVFSVAPIIGSIIGIGPILATSRLIGFD